MRSDRRHPPAEERRVHAVCERRHRLVLRQLLTVEAQAARRQVHAAGEPAQRFVDLVDSSTVMVNASTRFADGGQLGLGAEIGISTTRLHAYGPMGAEELTTTKFVVLGEGQVRH